jgi:hypothetical protein
MVNEKCKEEVKDFLMQHNTPAIRVATTSYSSGYNYGGWLCYLH